MLMGFSSGLPLLLVGQTLKGYLLRSGVDIKTIGIYSLVMMPYSLKMVWSPLMDRFVPLRLGRRRSWLLLTQMALIIAIALIPSIDPADHLLAVAILALLVAFLSASQDIVVDAYRREALPDSELALGASAYIIGYRLAVMMAGAGALYFADLANWKIAYVAMSLCMSVGIFATLWGEEPVVESPPPRTIRESVLGPLQEFFRRDGAWLVLAFIFLYKLGEQIANAMYTPFYMQIGFSNSEIASVAKVFAVAATLAGGFVGGTLVFRLGVYRALWLFGILQSLGLLVYAGLASIGHDMTVLASAVACEYFTSGMATTAFLAFMQMQTNKRFSATQYALMSSFTQLPMILLASTTGVVAASVGWTNYFIICAVITVPGLILLTKLKKFIEPSRAQ